MGWSGTREDCVEGIVTRSIIMAGNWKMYKSVGESVALVRALKEAVADVGDREIVVCPPFTSLYPVSKALKGSNVKVGAQNLYPAEEGAYTGEISPNMLVDVGCQYVILGHSERRQYFQESDQFINEKLKVALERGIKPILCVGETLEQREEGRQKSVVSMQVERDLQGIASEAMKDLAIAYEPIWAIGTGKAATGAGANRIVGLVVRGTVASLFGETVAQAVRIQYGGSVNPDNIAEFMNQPEIDGALVGGASLKAEDFIAIINA